MPRIASFQPRSATLAAVLCLCLLAPLGKASEIAGQPSTTSEETSSVKRDAEAPAPNPTASGAPQTLTEGEVAELAVRAEEPGPEVAGGALSNQHLTYIVIALAAAVIVLIAK
ncbi:MAG: hypothetical protein KIT09_00195 [Bryobacteraceae bacterium]|nr:hypothetical protein [Bryobacteraceae bacterium]